MQYNLRREPVMPTRFAAAVLFTLVAAPVMAATPDTLIHSMDQPTFSAPAAKAHRVEVDGCIGMPLDFDFDGDHLGRRRGGDIIHGEGSSHHVGGLERIWNEEYRACYAGVGR